MNIRVSITLPRAEATELSRQLRLAKWEPEDEEAYANQVVVKLDKCDANKLIEFADDLKRVIEESTESFASLTAKAPY